jgi:zinc-binding alcohol dehydrogenase/oxidoreductase
MKAIILRELGEPENLCLEDVPEPQPTSNEVLVRLKAAALNHRDVWIRRGLYAGIKLPRPNFRILGLPDDGTYAQFIKVPVSNVYPKPDPLSYEEAAAIPLASLTAYRAIVSRAQVQAGETVLVTGIGGGVSTLALLIAKKLGAHVLVTSGSNAKIAHASDLGADGGANYQTQDWGKEILALSGGKGPDVIIDSVGGETFAKAIEIIKPGGRIVTYGATTGPAKQMEIRRIFWKQIDVLGSTMGTPNEFEQMLGLYGHNGLRPMVDRVFPLAEAASAHRRMEEAAQFGKIVLQID